MNGRFKWFFGSTLVAYTMQRTLLPIWTMGELYLSGRELVLIMYAMNIPDRIPISINCISIPNLIPTSLYHKGIVQGA